MPQQKAKLKRPGVYAFSFSFFITCFSVLSCSFFFIFANQHIQNVHFSMKNYEACKETKYGIKKKGKEKK